MRAVILIPIGVVYLLLGGPDQSHSGIFYDTWLNMNIFTVDFEIIATE